MAKTFYIIDDHEMLRVGTRGWIMAHSNWICLGDSGAHEQAFNDFMELKKEVKLPSVLICDLNFYGENTGFDFIRQIHELYPEVKIAVYSMFFAAGMVQTAMENGASGYVSKNASSDILLECMEKIHAGEEFIQEDLQTKLIKYSKITDALTRREKEVMGLLLGHLSNDEIASELNIKKRAVENYISVIYEKIGVRDRADLVAKYGQ